MPRVGFHHSEQTKEKLRQLAKGVIHSEEYKTKMSEATRRHWESPAGMARRAKYQGMLKGSGHPMYGKHHNETSKKKMSLAKMGGTLPDEQKHKIGMASKRIGISPETRRKMGLSLRNTRKVQWQNPEYVIKQVTARGVKPNKKETYLGVILADCFPQFEYNGDGRLGVVLSGLVPDYVNTNGKKQIIEHFGRYWHQNARI